MELKFNHTNMDCYQTIHQCVHIQEETQEAIVPDACPDILRVVGSCGRVCLRATQARDGSATVTGIVVTTVLYLPDGESGLRRMEITVPFECAITTPALDSSGSIVAKTHLRNVDARALNPRKLLVRAEVAIELTAYMRQELSVCSDVECDVQAGLQQCKSEKNAYIISGVQVKPFSFTEQIRLSGQGDSGEVMTFTAQPVSTESKLIGNKLVLKGEVAVQALVREPAGGLYVSEHQLPFSQILEMPSAYESGNSTVALEVVQLNLLSNGDNGKQMDVQVELLAQAVVQSHAIVSVLEDAYSTAYEMELSREKHSVQTLLDNTSSTQNLRELFEVEGTVRKVVNCWYSLGEVIQQRDENRLKLHSNIHVWVMYLDENGGLQCFDKTVCAAVFVDCPKDMVCQCHSRCSQELYATPTAGGIEARVSICFTYALLNEQQINAIESGSIGALRKRGGDSPSVVLRRGAVGETLWDLAKCYGTTTAEIISANGLEETAVLPSGMLLIPSVRDI